VVSFAVSPSYVRSYGFAGPTIERKFPFISHSLPTTTMSLKLYASLMRCLFALSASLRASCSSSAFRFAVSLSASMPFKRDEVRRGANSSCLIFFGTTFFGFDLGFAADDPLAVGARPASAASISRLRRRACVFAMFSCRLRS